MASNKMLTDIEIQWTVQCYQRDRKMRYKYQSGLSGEAAFGDSRKQG